jgi:hypothetical protein
VTTIRCALEAVAKGEPTALRMAVEAMGVTLDLLDDTRDEEASSSRGADSKEQR